MSGAGTDACTPPAKPLAKIPASVLLSVTRIDLTDVESPEKLKLAVNAELKENVPPAVKAKPSPLGKTVGLRGTKVSDEGVRSLAEKCPSADRLLGQH